MPSKVLQQIQYLCKNIAKVEWSGVLFYTVEGSIKDPSTFKINLEHILPLDMGSASYTEYDFDARYIDFLEEDFDVRSKWTVGQIHSHHCMRVFFSGVDSSELNDNADCHNFYLSLIVNNYMDFIAKVATIGEAKMENIVVPYNAQDENGEYYEMEVATFKVDAKKLFIYECEIITPAEEIIVDEGFAKNVTTIMLPKPKPLPVVQPKKVYDNTSKGNGWQRHHQEEFDFYRGHGFDREDTPLASRFTEDEEEEETVYNEEDEPYYTFIMNLYNICEMELDEDDDPEIVFEYFDLVSDLTPKSLSATIMKRYMKTFYEDFPQSNINEFAIHSYRTLEILGEYAILYPILTFSIKAINALVTQTIKDGKSSNRTASKI
jgi:hypothetical protein